MSDSLGPTMENNYWMVIIQFKVQV